jgi:hypothetical protein
MIVSKLVVKSAFFVAVGVQYTTNVVDVNYESGIFPKKDLLPRDRASWRAIRLESGLTGGKIAVRCGKPRYTI